MKLKFKVLYGSITIDMVNFMSGVEYVLDNKRLIEKVLKEDNSNIYKTKKIEILELAKDKNESEEESVEKVEIVPLEDVVEDVIEDSNEREEKHEYSLSDNKPTLQKGYLEKFGEEPNNEMTKKQLLAAILE